MFEDLWQDVDALRNIGLLRIGCEMLGVPGTIVTHALPRRLQGVDLQGQMMTLAEYKAVQDAVTSAAGHPYHLVEVGHCGAGMSFGAEALKKFLATKVPILNRLTSPWNAYAELPEGALLWNDNKLWWTEKPTDSSAFLFCVYAPGRFGTPRSSMDDRRSLYFLIRGMNEAFPAQWPSQSGMSEVHHRMVQLDITAFLGLELGNHNFAISGGKLHVNGVACGELVWLIPDEDGKYRGVCVHQQTSPAIPGMRITRDIHTACKRCRDITHPIAFSGDVFQIGEEFPHTLVEVNWQRCFADQLQRIFPVRSRDFRHRLLAEHQLDAIQKRAVTAEHMAQLAKATLAHNFPNELTALEVLEGRFGKDGVRVQRDIVLEADIVGSVHAGASQQAEKWATQKQSFLDAAAEIAGQHGLWLYKRIGDALLVIGTDGFGDVSGCGNVQKGLRGMMTEMLEFSVQLHYLAEEMLSVQLRIGIAVGDEVWNVYADRSKIDATGDPCVQSTDLEGAAVAGATFVTEAAYQLADHSRHLFIDLGDIQTKKRGRMHVYQLRESTVHVVDFGNRLGRRRE